MNSSQFSISRSEVEFLTPTPMTYLSFSFSSETIRIPVGSTVEWRNTLIATHTVAGDPSRIHDPEQVALPAGAEPFSSGEIGRGQLWRHTFTVPGNYRSACHPHHDIFGMTGTVEVGR